MKTVVFNGKEIKTNVDASHGFATGNESWSFHRPSWILSEGEKYRHMESEREMFERLAKEGYSKITFYWLRTSVRGYYDLVARCEW